MSRVPDLPRRGVGFRLLNPQRRERRLHFRDSSRRRRFVVARVREPRARALDGFAERPVAAREEHLFPPAHLVPQPCIAARLRRLPLERTLLLLDLEDDVVEPRQVLLRGFELELRRAAPGLVLRDAGGFLDQLAPIGRPRAEDHADLALLDDGVGLGAEARIHHQFVDVPEAALVPVDQVLALTGAEQPAGHLHIAREHRRGHLGEGVVAVRTRPGRRGLVAHLLLERRRHHHAAQLQPYLRRAGGLAGIGPAEDDVLHLLATQALGALLAEDPGQGIGDVALAAPVGPDDGGDAFVEGELRSVGKGFETGQFESFEAHDKSAGRGTPASLASPSPCGKAEG